MPSIWRRSTHGKGPRTLIVRSRAHRSACHRYRTRRTGALRRDRWPAGSEARVGRGRPPRLHEGHQAPPSTVTNRQPSQRLDRFKPSSRISRRGGPSHHPPGRWVAREPQGVSGLPSTVPDDVGMRRGQRGCAARVAALDNGGVAAKRTDTSPSGCWLAGPSALVSCRGRGNDGRAWSLQEDVGMRAASRFAGVGGLAVAASVTVLRPGTRANRFVCHQLAWGWLSGSLSRRPSAGCELPSARPSSRSRRRRQRTGRSDSLVAGRSQEAARPAPHSRDGGGPRRPAPRGSEH